MKERKNIRTAMFYDVTFCLNFRDLIQHERTTREHSSARDRSVFATCYNRQ